MAFIGAASIGQIQLERAGVLSPHLSVGGNLAPCRSPPFRS